MARMVDLKRSRWPAGGEIDIMEFYRGKLLAKLACMRADGKPQWFSNTFYTDSLGKNKWANQFHVWQMGLERKFYHFIARWEGAQ